MHNLFVAIYTFLLFNTPNIYKNTLISNKVKKKLPPTMSFESNRNHKYYKWADKRDCIDAGNF